MRRYSTIVHLIALAALLALICVSPSTAVVPKPDGNVTVNLAQGWFADQLAWYIGTATNNVSFAMTGGLTLAPKLSSAITDGTARNIYIVQNFQQGPVFSASPSVLASLYTGLWRVNYVKWTTAAPRPITNSDPESVANPNGLPVTGATITPTSIVLDYPILIIGGLGLGQPTYTIPQLISYNKFSKTALLPFFNTFCQDNVTKKVTVQRGIITESSDLSVASVVGANFTLSLALMSTGDSMNAWLMNPILAINPPGQLPVLEYCPTALSWRNTNFNYSPIVKGHLLFRLTATNSSIFTNPTTVNALITSGALAQAGTTTLNISVLDTLPK